MLISIELRFLERVLTWNRCFIPWNDDCPVDEGNDMRDSKDAPMKDAEKVLFVGVGGLARWREALSNRGRDC